MSTDYYQDPAATEEYIQPASQVNAATLIALLRPYLSKNSRLLELGTGPGSDWAMLSQDYNVTKSLKPTTPYS